MYRDRVREIRKAAAAPTLEDMRRERKGLPAKLSRLITYLVNNLFNCNLTATLAWSKAEINDHRLWAAFSDATGWSLAKYIEKRRLEIAVRMMQLAPDLELARISYALGYDCHGTFVRQYKKWLGKTPAKARRGPRSPALDLLEVWRYLCGELDAEAAWRVHEMGVRLYPAFEKRLRERYGQTAGGPQLEINGGRIEQLTAEGLWQELRGLPFEEQKRSLRGVRFHSRALFDLLRKKSREEGRRDRRRGVEVAELALVSLVGSEDIFGEQIHDLRALGWASLGNAHRRALDLPAACAAINETHDHWAKAKVSHDPLVAAEIKLLEGTLRMCQRSYDAALELVDRAGLLFRSAADADGQIKALTQRASICGYAGRPDESIVALQQALTLLEQTEDPYLAFGVWGNMANAQARVGRYSEASKSLERARASHAALDYPVGAFELKWVDGNIKDGLGDLESAMRLYVESRAGFARTREPGCFSLASLDLAVLYARSDDWREVMHVASETIPILESLRLHEQTLAAVRLLADAAQEQELTDALLREVRDHLQQDPLTRMAQNEDRELFPVL